MRLSAWACHPMKTYSRLAAVDTCTYCNLRVNAGVRPQCSSEGGIATFGSKINTDIALEVRYNVGLKSAPEGAKRWQ